MKQVKDFVLENMEMVFVSVCFTILIICLLAPAVNKVLNERDVVVTVTDTGIKNTLKNSRYLVYCKDENNETKVFEITDSIFKFRFDSSDVYPNILPNHTYRFTICGKRVPILSWYPNIYDYEIIE